VLSTRIRPDTRAALEKASKKSGRSLSQEIEHRLRRTIIEDEKIEAAFGSRQNFNIMRTVAMALHLRTGHLAERDGLPYWLTDAKFFDQTVKMVGNVLSALRPPDAEPPNIGPTRHQLLEQLNGFLAAPPEANPQFSPQLIENLNAIIADVAAMDIWRLIDIAEPGQRLTKGTFEDHRRGLLKADLKGLLPRTRTTEDQEWKRHLVRSFEEAAQRKTSRTGKGRGE
jgi:hypothetical protein